ncbi:hypothetical protein AVEN_191641-1 [Araneus ventricosus]|uniref:Uncharacterized protein n=1 Tax=Araneus ventricosus TaxID=182803 RepID=A0A4Y2MEW6_ARAVE|nr:hypothetical protein AVEN_191641-1 [Araneus ventricosus]
MCDHNESESIGAGRHAQRSVLCRTKKGTKRQSRHFYTWERADVKQDPLEIVCRLNGGLFSETLRDFTPTFKQYENVWEYRRSSTS